MKTKDFIKMLQKEDPSGEGYIRLGDGVPVSAEAKEGYWDGPFTYINTDNNFVTSINGYKVDIHCENLEDFVSNRVNGDNWDEIKNKIKFEFEGYAEVRAKERIDSILRRAKEAFDEMKEIIDNLYDEGLCEMRINAEKGWAWVVRFPLRVCRMKSFPC